MSENRPFVLSIAGFDPSAGAGVLADVKTFEQHRVYGFAINTAITIQTDSNFIDIHWADLDFVLRSIETLFENYEIKAVKIGITPSLTYLKAVIFEIKKHSPQTLIVWDPVLKSTTEFTFLQVQNQTDLIAILEHIDLITPNYDEILKLDASTTNVESIVKNFSNHCAILLKGGHHPHEIGVDYLHTKDQFFRLAPKNTLVYEKHGSGCVLSSSIASNLALGQELLYACTNAKNYIENYLFSNSTKLGYHYV
jgi:hydroxymethylpyrimidine/phosphomethylpyrimidine kinase